MNVQQIGVSCQPAEILKSQFLLNVLLQNDNEADFSGFPFQDDAICRNSPESPLLDFTDYNDYGAEFSGFCKVAHSREEWEFEDRSS